MKRTLLLAFAAISLISTTGCDSKKQDPAPISVPAGQSGLRCQVNGQPYAATETEARINDTSGTRVLTIDATQTLAPGSRVYVSLFFSKPVSAPESAYKFIGARHEGDKINTTNLEDNPVGTLKAVNGRWEGTFRVEKLRYQSTQVQFALTDGSFSAKQ